MESNHDEEVSPQLNSKNKIREKLLRLQKGRCLMCDRQLTRAICRIDHDHKTGLVRGLLCPPCNHTAAAFDRIKNMGNGVEIYRRWQKRVGAIQKRLKVVVAASLHEPRLPTILMIERAIKDAHTLGKARLWKSLPRAVEYPTFLKIIEYLVACNKIVFDKEQIVWVFPDNPKLDKLLNSHVTTEPPQRGRWMKTKK